MSVERALFKNMHIIRKRPILVGLFVLGWGFIDAILHTINVNFWNLPLFFDTIGTLVVAAGFGILPGLITAVFTHFSWELINGLTGVYLPWMAINMSSALIMGYMGQKEMFSTPIHIVVAIVSITLVNAVLGAFIATVLYSGITEHQVDYLVVSFIATGQQIAGAAFWARIPVNIIDKGLAVMIAFLFAHFWFEKWKVREEE